MNISSLSNSYSMFSHLIPLYLTLLRIFHNSHLKCIFTAWQMSFSLNFSRYFQSRIFEKKESSISFTLNFAEGHWKNKCCRVSLRRWHLGAVVDVTVWQLDLQLQSSREFEPCSWRGVLDPTLCDKSFSLTCDKSVVFYGYAGFFHQ